MALLLCRAHEIRELTKFGTNGESDYSGFAIGVDRSEKASCGFLSGKTTPRELFGTTVIAKPL
jgi:hypothetical protein